MERPEDPGEDLDVLRIFFEDDEILIELVESFIALDQELLDQLVLFVVDLGHSMTSAHGCRRGMRELRRASDMPSRESTSAAVAGGMCSA